MTNKINSVNSTKNWRNKMKLRLMLPTLLILSGCGVFRDYDVNLMPDRPTTDDFELSDLESVSGDLDVGPTTPMYIPPDISNDTALTVSDKSRFIVVNIPSQTLRAFEDGREVLRSRVIVGRPNTPTPVQVSEIYSIKLNPDWHAPRGGNIERTYTSRLRSGDAAGLRAINIDWYQRPNGTYQFFQRPGPHNVLGMVKFEMHSPSHTYLHDTNRPDLYNLNERLLSFGCVRVEHWDILAAWMLGWEPNDLHEYLKNNTHTEWKNIDNFEIHIVYWVNEIVDGRSMTWPNVYNRRLD